MSIESFFSGYLEAALFSSTDESTPEGGVPLDKNYTAEDFTPEALETLRKDCKAFYEANYELWGTQPDSEAGADFWLTRNGHGCGFWDGDYPEHGEKLTALCKPYGSVYLYVGDDQQIHCS